jgi:hypothetical protein
LITLLSLSVSVYSSEIGKIPVQKKVLRFVEIYDDQVLENVPQDKIKTYKMLLRQMKSEEGFINDEIARLQRKQADRKLVNDYLLGRLTSSKK